MKQDIEESQKLRLRIVGLVSLSLVVALFARLWYLQVLRTDEFRSEASSNIVRVIYEQAPRGRVIDAKGRVLVDNKMVYTLVIDREKLNSELDIAAQDEMLVELAVLLSRTGRLTKAKDIESRLASRRVSPFDAVPVAWDINYSLVFYLGEHAERFPGVSVEQRTIRVYPYGELAAHVLGYVGQLNAEEYANRTARYGTSAADVKPYQLGGEIGKSGVERIFEDTLRGIPSQRVIHVNAWNDIVSERFDLASASVAGNDIHLTIDVDIQHLVERELRRALNIAKQQESEPESPEFVAAAGAAVAINPRDGSILAMASFPTYDPREFVGGISQSSFDELNNVENYSPILNRVIQGEYPPGSTFKLVTAYAALTQDLIGSSSDALIDIDEFYQDTGTYRYPFCVEESDTCTFRSPYCCNRSIDLRDSLVVSSDTYFYRLAGEGFFHRKAPLDEGIQESARLFGLGSRSGIQLPYERSGVVPDRDYYERLHQQGVFLRGGDQWYVGDTINLAIGQGTLLVTPLQMANVYAALASGGKIHQPNMVSRITDHEGNVVKRFGPRLLSEVDMPSHVVEPLLDGLNGVTAYRFQRGDVAPLEGTAYAAFKRLDFPLDSWPVAGKTGTSEKKGKADFAWFVGFGPASWPELNVSHTPEIVVAMVLEEAGFGGDIAAPAVARVLLPVATGDIPIAQTADEIDACRSEVTALTVYLEGVRTGVIKVDSEGIPLSVERPELSLSCAEMVGGVQAVEERGLGALGALP